MHVAVHCGARRPGGSPDPSLCFGETGAQFGERVCAYALAHRQNFSLFRWTSYLILFIVAAVKVAVTISLDHTYVTALKAECRRCNLHFSEYVMTALQTFVSPTKFAELRAEALSKAAEVPK